MNNNLVQVHSSLANVFDQYSKAYASFPAQPHPHDILAVHGRARAPATQHPHTFNTPSNLHKAAVEAAAEGAEAEGAEAEE